MKELNKTRTNHDEAAGDEEILGQPDLSSRREALLELLQDGEWHPNYKCAEVGGLSFNGSISTLRREGWQIEARPIGAGVWERRLAGRQTPLKMEKRISRPQQRVLLEVGLAVRKAYGEDGFARVGKHLPGWLKREVVNAPSGTEGTSRGSR